MTMLVWLAVARGRYNSANYSQPGWPGVTHGGAIATIMQECLERVIDGPGFSKDKRGERAALEDISVEYRKPTKANALFIIKAEVEEVAPVSGRIAVKARLENALSGVVCAEASGHCKQHGLSLLEETDEATISAWDTAMKALKGLWS